MPRLKSGSKTSWSFCITAFAVLCASAKNLDISVSIFLEESNFDLEDIVHHAIEKYEYNHKNASLENHIRLNFTLVSHNRMMNSILNLEQHHSTSLRLAIFVQVSKHETGMSSIMERLNITTIGLFQTDGILTTQENPVDFTRVASPSMLYYACTLRDMVQKMGWRRLSLVMSADQEGKVLADAMLETSRKEKWKILRTVWISRSEISTELKSILMPALSNESDAVIMHVRDKNNEDLFRLVQILGVSQFKATWALTDVTTYGIWDNNVLPRGFVRISPWKSPEHDFMEHALYDAFRLIELSVKDAAEQSSRETGEDLQGLIKKKIRGTYFQGKTSLFENPALAKGPFATMDISNVKQDLEGHKHWWSIGLRTYSGIALEAFDAPNGRVLSPLLAPSKPTVRVPVVLYPPWIEAEEPHGTEANHMTCLKRGYFCFNKTDITVDKLCCFGLSIDLLKILERELGFVPEIYFVADGQYGTFSEKTGKWNGIMDELVSGRGDLALDMAMTEKRAEHIAFSFPYLPLALNVLVQKEGGYQTGVQWYSWLKPFHVDLWITILGTCNVILLVIWWLDRKSPTGYYRILKESDKGGHGFSMLDAMSYVWGVAFSKDIGAEKSPRSISARCVSTVYAFMAMVIVNTYCANLMAFLVQDNFELPIDSIKDPKVTDVSLFPPDGFQLGILRGSFAQTYFRNHVDYQYRQLYKTNLKLNLMNNFTNGVMSLQNGEIHGLVADYLSLRQAANMIPNCSYGLAGQNFYMYGLSIALPKNSPWLEDITRVVLAMKENGSISTLEKMYFDKKICRTSNAKDLSILNFSGLFLTVAGTIGFCFLALLAEVISIFVLVRFGQHLGALGKFSVRLLFDLKKGEEHLIRLKYSTIRKKRKCVKLDLIKIENAASSGTTVELQRNSTNTATRSYLNELRVVEGNDRRWKDGYLNDSVHSNSTSRMQLSLMNGGFRGNSANSNITRL